MNATIQNNTITSVSQFLNELRIIRNSLWRVDEKNELWFRGQDKEYNESILRPEIYRQRTGRAIRRTDDLLEIESQLFEEFKRGGEQFRDAHLDHKYWEWDAYLLFQHHGGVTRLLDWSDGALIALHFALRDPKQDECDEDSVVYILEPDRLNQRLKLIYEEIDIKNKWRSYARSQQPGHDLNESNWEEAYLPCDNAERSEFKLPNAPLILDSPHITRRVSAQRSRFILFGADYQFLSDEIRREDSAIKRLYIDRSSRSSIRAELRYCGVTESVIYPDLDGLGREMRQRWEEQK